jgi:hypothetical protein
MLTMLMLVVMSLMGVEAPEERPAAAEITVPSPDYAYVRWGDMDRMR